MASPVLDTAVQRVRTVFAGMTSPGETGCGLCHLPEETALLRTPDVELPDDVLRMFTHEVPSHFDDHPAVMRRILPQLAGQLATGRYEGPCAYEMAGLGRSGWRTWPTEQAEAVRVFLEAWWADTVGRARPLYPAVDVFDACVVVGATVTPFLATWARQPPGGPADEQLHDYLELWIDELLDDRPLFSSWWGDHRREEPVAEFQAWIAAHAPGRLRGRGADAALLFKVGLLNLPRERRFTDEAWEDFPG